MTTRAGSDVVATVLTLASGVFPPLRFEIRNQLPDAQESPRKTEA